MIDANHGWLSIIQYRYRNRICYGLSKQEFQRLQTVLLPDEQHQRLDDFAKQENLDLPTLKRAVYKLKIQNDNQTLHPDHKPRTKFYRKSDLEYVKNFMQKRNQDIQYLDLKKMAPNSLTHFQRGVDYTVFTLGRFLDPKHPANNRTVIQWVQYQRVPYSLDHNHKLFFTPHQAQTIKARYRQRDPKYSVTTKMIAKALKTTPSAINKFGHTHQIKGKKILGYLSNFYTPEQFETFKTMWPMALHQNRPHNLKYKRHQTEES